MEFSLVMSLIGLTLLLAKLAEELTLKAGLPYLLGPLTLGAFLSVVPAFKEEYEFAPILFTIGLNFTAFLMGTEDLGFTIKNVDRGRFKEALKLFLSPFLVSLCVLSPFMDPNYSILISAIFAMPSTIRINSLLKHIELDGFEEFLTIAEIAEIIATVLLYSLLVIERKFFILTLFFILLILRYGEELFKRFFEYEEKFLARELPLSFIIAMILVLGYASEQAGLNSALVSLIMGIVASEYLIERPWLKSKLRTINHSFFEPLFFVGSAALINPFSLDMRLTAILILDNFLLSAVKAYVVKRMTGWSWRTSFLTTVKGGIDTAILASQYRIGKLPSELYSGSIATVLLNTFVIGSLAIKKEKKSKSLPKFCDLELERAAVDLSVTLREVLEMMKNGRDTVVVVDVSNWPIGYVTINDVLRFDKEELDNVRVYEVYRDGIPVFDCEDNIGKVLAVEEEIEEYPLVAVVKRNLGYVGSVQTTKVFKKLIELGAK